MKTAQYIALLNRWQKKNLGNRFEVTSPFMLFTASASAKWPEDNKPAMVEVEGATFNESLKKLCKALELI